MLDFVSLVGAVLALSGGGALVGSLLYWRNRAQAAESTIGLLQGVHVDQIATQQALQNIRKSTKVLPFRKETP